METTKQAEIAQFVDQYVTGLPRCYSWFDEYEVAWARGPRPTAEEIARELVQVAEFRALKLGTWLNTTDGQVIAEAVEMVAPPFYRQDVELVVEALQLARGNAA